MHILVFLLLGLDRFDSLLSWPLQTYVWGHLADLFRILLVVVGAKQLAWMCSVRFVKFQGPEGFAAAVSLSQITEYSLMFTGVCPPLPVPLLFIPALV